MKPTVDLVCITYEGDSRLMELQILSVDRLFSHKQIGAYLIVLNGRDNVALEGSIREKTFDRISHSLKDKIAFVADNEVLDGAQPIGRRNQQLLKLLVARKVTAEHYLLLDSKNHFVRHTSLDEFYLDGLPKTVFRKPSPTLEGYARAALDFFEKNNDELIENSLPTTTPYIMIRNEVMDLMRHIELRLEKPFPEAFNTTLRTTTEFYLYYAHLVSKGRGLPYSDAPGLVITLFTVWPQENQMVMDFIQRAGTGIVPMFGLHRLRLPQLNENQKTAIERMWRRDLLLPEEDAEWFMVPVS